jgi:anti-sigma regulatory factor (Ser/Thr protein kinase)
VPVAVIGRSSAPSVLSLPFEVDSVPKARKRLALELRRAHVSRDRTDDALLVLSELIGNALRHARPLESGLLRVSWSFRHDGLEIAVTDGGGPTNPRELHPPVTALGGRGLSIVRDLAVDWGVRHDESGTTVYAVLAMGARLAHGR